ncbi:MAG TPA: hypothetical protein P5137_17300, partial [Candidatus Brocadiia bacterium]|nr:hypothetical protein [Candidatus Brocadiia bacterium]
ARAACKQTPQKPPATTAATSTSSTGSVGGPVATLPQPPAAPAITSPNAKPMWVDSIGPWKEEWREKHASKGDAAASRYEWVVGTSQPVENESQDALARQSASQDAIFHFMRLLGMDFESNARTGEVWSTAQTGHLVNAIYRKSLQDEMFKNKVNLDAYDSWPYTVTQGLVKRYVVKVLYRVDMGKFAEQNVLQKAKDNMIQDLKRTRELTEAEREKAIRAAQKLVDDAIATNPLLKPAQK